MVIPGTNSFINVIGSLLGLCGLVDNGRWAETLQDIRWVIQEVRAAVEQHGYNFDCIVVGHADNLV